MMDTFKVNGDCTNSITHIIPCVESVLTTLELVSSHYIFSIMATQDLLETKVGTSIIHHYQAPLVL